MSFVFMPHFACNRINLQMHLFVPKVNYCNDQKLCVMDEVSLVKLFAVTSVVTKPSWDKLYFITAQGSSTVSLLKKDYLFDKLKPTLK